MSEARTTVRQRHVAPPKTWSFTTWPTAPAGATCPCTDLRLHRRPRSPSTTPTEVELGVKFQASADGFVPGVRFYKGPSNSGPHIGDPVVGGRGRTGHHPRYFESASGWQTVYFPTHRPDYRRHHLRGLVPHGERELLGHRWPVLGGRRQRPLAGLRASTAGGNGVYRYGGRSFPTNSYGDSGYGVDGALHLLQDLTSAHHCNGQPGQRCHERSDQHPTTHHVERGRCVRFSAGNSLLVQAATSLGQLHLMPSGSSPYVCPDITAQRCDELHRDGYQRPGQGGQFAICAFAATFQTAGLAACPCSIFASDSLPATAGHERLERTGTRYALYPIDQWLGPGDQVLQGRRQYRYPHRTPLEQHRGLNLRGDLHKRDGHRVADRHAGPAAPGHRGLRVHGSYRPPSVAMLRRPDPSRAEPG